MDQLLGKPVHEWAAIRTIMEARGLRSPDDLERALGDPERRVKVVDAVNPKRVLGTLPRAAMRDEHQIINFACRGPIRFDRVPDTCLELSRVSLERDVLKNGWDVEVVLKTCNRLDDLMKVDDFRLPGEGRRDAELRRHGY